MKALASACLALAALLGLYMALHPLGARFAIGTYPVPQGTGWPYQLESGFVPALAVLTLAGSLASLWHLHNCHFESCWRIGKHRVSGTPWCSRHMHLGKPHRSVEELLEQILSRLSQPGPRPRGGAR